MVFSSTNHVSSVQPVRPKKAKECTVQLKGAEAVDVFEPADVNRISLNPLKLSPSHFGIDNIAPLNLMRQHIQALEVGGVPGLLHIFDNAPLNQDAQTTLGALMSCLTQNQSFSVPYQVKMGSFGFRESLQDEDLFSPAEMGAPRSEQVNHFLTAVMLGFESSPRFFFRDISLALCVGHEHHADTVHQASFVRRFTNFLTQGLKGITYLFKHPRLKKKLKVLERQAAQFGTSQFKRNDFDQHLDRFVEHYLDMPWLRTKENDQHFASRSGNSLQDLKLTTIGWIFGSLIRRGIIKKNKKAHDFLKTLLTKSTSFDMKLSRQKSVAACSPSS